MTAGTRRTRSVRNQFLEPFRQVGALLLRVQTGQELLEEVAWNYRGNAQRAGGQRVGVVLTGGAHMDGLEIHEGAAQDTAQHELAAGQKEDRRTAVALEGLASSR